MEAPASPRAIGQGELNPRKRLKSEGAEDVIKDENEEEEEELERLLLHDPNQLPVVPPSAVDSNFAHYFIVDFLKPGHDQYIYRHANGLCVVGLAPTHVALAEEGGITAVDFNTGKTDKSEMKVIGKRKKVYWSNSVQQGVSCIYWSVSRHIDEPMRLAVNFHQSWSDG